MLAGYGAIRATAAPISGADFFFPPAQERSMFKPLLASAALVAFVPAQADTLAQWTFETSVPTTAGPLAPEVGSGSALAFHIGASTYSNPVGNGSNESFSST